MAKTEEDLRQSRDNREQVIKLLGCVPESILLHSKADKAIDLMVEEEGRDYSAKSYQDKGGPQDKAFTVSGMTCRGKGAGLSRFPQNIGRLLLRLYTKEGDTVVDPFAGHNSRMELCWRAGRNYIGQDLSKDFMVANRKIRDMLLKEVRDDLLPQSHSQAKIELNEGDSRKLVAGDIVGDFTITSPPYWDLEYYGDEPEQLGTGRSYDEFLTGLQQVANENYRCLKDGSFCVWCVNDFRKDGLFYNYHGDTTELLLNAGFTQWDVAITDLGSSFGAAFAQQVVERKILPKRHEYCLIFRKQIGTTQTRIARKQRTQSEPKPMQQVVAMVDAIAKTNEPKKAETELDNKWVDYWKQRDFHRDPRADIQK